MLRRSVARRVESTRENRRIYQSMSSSSREILVPLGPRADPRQTEPLMPVLWLTHHSRTRTARAYKPHIDVSLVTGSWVSQAIWIRSALRAIELVAFRCSLCNGHKGSLVQPEPCHVRGPSGLSPTASFALNELNTLGVDPRAATKHRSATQAKARDSRSS